jgi:hypothetical protein
MRNATLDPGESCCDSSGTEATGAGNTAIANGPMMRPRTTQQTTHGYCSLCEGRGNIDPREFVDKAIRYEDTFAMASYPMPTRY